MKLQAPYTGGYVEATGKQAEYLISKGFKKVTTPRKPAKKKG